MGIMGIIKSPTSHSQTARNSPMAAAASRFVYNSHNSYTSHGNYKKPEQPQSGCEE